ncbi:signal recognition particle subunit SRP68-like isoform X2 [Schistocerca gregaria]|uniref:signal recognition particle subunit SRP68-like isoform X2 n=1 Tax=Schistocerca gregaria TaxID=7010 RepID=UPI00211E9AFF|nr:signal recognition particle subunit SRP68-like isoform X2 [Schistocerca gregaria]
MSQFFLPFYNNEAFFLASYCTRRIRRISKAFNKAGPHSKKGKQQFKGVKIVEVQNVRALELLLLHAERAWARAMELKENEETNHRTRFRVRRRLKKAVRWSNYLIEVSEDCVDDRTSLEIQAYANWIKSVYLFECKSGKNVVDQLTVAKAHYMQLILLVQPHQKQFYLKRVEEIEIMLKYTMLDASSQSLSTSYDNIQDMLMIAAHDPTLKVLESKLQGSIKETHYKQVNQTKDLFLLGKPVPVQNTDLRICILNLDKTLAKMHDEVTDLQTKFDLIDRILVLINDTRQHITEQKRLIQDDDASTKGLDQLTAYLGHIEREQLKERNLLLSQEIEQKIDQAGLEKASLNDLGDIVRYYEFASQLLDESGQLICNTEFEDPDRRAHQEVQFLAFKGMRCYYIGLACAVQERWDQALALWERSKQYVELAKRCQTPTDETQLTGLIKKLEEKLSTAKIWGCAKAYLFDLYKREEDANAQENADKSDPKRIGDPFFYVKRVNLHCIEREKIVEFPPFPNLIPCKSIFLDLARKQCSAPDLKEETKAPRTGFFSRFW